MNKINKKIIVPLIVVLLITIAFFSVAKTKITNSLINKQDYKEDIELDNWELSTVFYDSTVGDGKTPLTEINWDASDGGCDQGESRTITIQINYKNTNTVTNYAPGELVIKIPNFINKERKHFNTTIIASANDANHSNYDWTFRPQLFVENGFSHMDYSPKDELEYFYFENAISIENKSNLEGNIQLIYQIKPASEKGRIIEFEDAYTISYQTNFNAILNNEIESNELSFNYIRNLICPWERYSHDFEKSKQKISSFDGLGEDAASYTWIKYRFHIGGSFVSSSDSYRSYPYIKERYMTIKDELPDDCIVYDENFNLIDHNNGTYSIRVNGYNDFSKDVYAYVGYPKNTYNEENNNMNIETTASLYINYKDGQELLHKTSTTSLNLGDFSFSYSGNLYGIYDYFRKYSYSSYKTYEEYYQSLTGEDIELSAMGIYNTGYYVNAIYTGTKMDVKFGKDLLIITDSNNNYRVLQGDEYYYTNITYNNARNGNGQLHAEEKYQCQLWVRHGNSSEYVLHDTFTNKDTSWQFSQNDAISGYYFIIKDLDESFVSSPSNNATLRINNARDIAQEGYVYDFDFLQVFQNGNLVNAATIDNYSAQGKEIISSSDLSNYGSYVQRGTASEPYYYFVMEDLEYSFKITNQFSQSKQNAVEERFEGNLKLTIGDATSNSSFLSNKEIGKYALDAREEKMCVGWEIFDLLPYGMVLTSSEEDILSSLSTSNSTIYGGRIFDRTGKQYTNEEFQDLISRNQRVEVIKNYKNSDRTYIHITIDLTNEPIFETFTAWNGSVFINYSIDYAVTYDSYIENGNNFTNRSYLRYYQRDFDPKFFRYSFHYSTNYAEEDSGIYDNEEKDINNDNSTTDMYSISSTSLTLNSAIATNQDIQVSASNNSYTYSSNKEEVNYSSNYEYKLRARTGQNDVKNLVIYDSIEKYAKDSEQNFINANGIKGHWQGEFLGVDTSYAESKGYNVKVYYSESEQPGSIKNDNSWKVYNDSVDKTKVKSLAFEYLNDNNQPAVLPANSLTYVLIKMKAPAEHFKTFAYNGCWTEWNAIDPITEQPVDFVTGINSNIVRVALPSSVEMEDMELTLTKKWQDNSNRLNKRPENVTYHIVANGDYQNAQDITFSGNGNTWSTTIEVPKYDDNGEEISYEVLEDTINLEDNYKYVSSIDEYEVTNTLYKNIIITKNWLDNSNSYLTRPPNITVKVYRNGSYYKDLNITGTYNTNTWTGSLSVPVYDNTGNEYNYTVDEINIDNYSTSCENLVCTNTLIGNENIVIQKEWIDNSNSHNTRPENVTIHLKQNGNNYRDITINGNNSSTWNSETINVPKYDNNGVKYTYTVSEDTVPKYGLVEYDQEHYKVINTLKETTLLTITKIWKDNDNAYNTRPENLKITVLQNGNNYQTVTLTGTSNTWVTTLEVPKYDNNQNEYHYSIKEESNAEYSDITYSEDSLTVTNGLKKDYDLTITKIWDDNNNEYLVRPENIKVKILQNGEEYQEVTINGSSNKWTKTIRVPYYDSDYKKYEYTIQENVEVPKYGSVTYDQTTHTITNKLTEILTVTLYFTVKTAYVDPITGELKYDEEGFNKILEKYNVDPSDEYVFTFTLQNLDTHKTYDGKLTTKGILEFSDIPYGKYEAVQGKDELFEFVDMTSLGEVLGVSFEKVGNKGIITIKPTGQNIIFGAQLLNKIEAPPENPPTNSGINKSILLSLGVLTLFLLIMYVIKPQRYLIKI